MLPLNKGNSYVDPTSGAILFKGSPEVKALKEIQNSLCLISKKLDRLINLLSEGGINYGGKMETPGFSKDNDSKI